jgi:heptosyltransferase-2
MTYDKKQNSLLRLLAQRYTPPFHHDLPSTVPSVLANESWRQKCSKNFNLIKRWLTLKLNLPAHLLRDQLPPPPARLLWIHYSTVAIGDSIMDLAGRAMLGGYSVHLLTSKQNAELFHGDRFFGKVFTDASEINAAEYDFVLLDLFNTRSIQLKRRLCPALPFACLQGFFYGFNFNRTLFSCYRIHHLLGYPHGEKELGRFLRPSLFVENDPAPLPPKRKQNRFALMLGGMDARRTYRHWPAVIQNLRDRWPSDREFPEFVLIGSQNGRPDVESVLSALIHCEATSCVGALTLRQTTRVIADSDFFMGPDGGLMHCAIALEVPGIAIFRRLQPHLFLPPQSDMQSLYDPIDVNNVPPNTVTEVILKHPWMSGHRHATVPCI